MQRSASPKGEEGRGKTEKLAVSLGISTPLILSGSHTNPKALSGKLKKGLGLSLTHSSGEELMYFKGIGRGIGKKHTHPSKQIEKKGSYSSSK